MVMSAPLPVVDLWRRALAERSFGCENCRSPPLRTMPLTFDMISSMAAINAGLSEEYW